MDMVDLTGKTALVTGAGRGIGRDFALALANAGADVIVHYAANEIMAETVCNEIREMGRHSFTIRADLKLPDSANKIGEMAFDKFSTIDILVLNASIQFRKPWQDIIRSDFDEQFACNLYASLRLIQQFAPGMQHNKWGRIITVGSIHERKPNPDMLLYAASKAAQTIMGKSLAVKLAPDGITVNNLAPGVILTDRNAAALQSEDWRKQVTDRIPSGHIGRPDDCVGILLTLCSDAGQYITGQSIYIDGGMSAS